MEVQKPNSAWLQGSKRSGWKICKLRFFRNYAKISAKMAGILLTIFGLHLLNWNRIKNRYEYKFLSFGTFGCFVNLAWMTVMVSVTLRSWLLCVNKENLDNLAAALEQAFKPESHGQAFSTDFAPGWFIAIFTSSGHVLLAWMLIILIFFKRLELEVFVNKLRSKIFRELSPYYLVSRYRL